MLATRGAALLLLHLALQPWLAAGAQATPQGKWARAGAGATGPGPSVLVEEPAVPLLPLGEFGSCGLARHLSVPLGQSQSILCLEVVISD